MMQEGGKIVRQRTQDENAQVTLATDRLIESGANDSH